MSREMLDMVDVLAREKNVEKSAVFGVLEIALASAVKKAQFPGEDADVAVRVDPNTGDWSAVRRWVIVSDDQGLQQPDREEMFSDIHDDYPELEVGDYIEKPIENINTSGRRFAQDAKQVILQRLRDAEREQILKNAMASYKKVLGCSDGDLGLLSGSSKNTDCRYMFAMAQTLSKPEILERFAADEFDYILVDEAHHVGAERYQRILNHFANPGFLLGMTATPERTDGYNIYSCFGHNIAYEIRLQRALDEDMLCPFHYYGVAEYLGEDGTRLPEFYNGTYEYLKSLGIEEI